MTDLRVRSMKSHWRPKTKIAPTLVNTTLIAPRARGVHLLDWPWVGTMPTAVNASITPVAKNGRPNSARHPPPSFNSSLSGAVRRNGLGGEPGDALCHEVSMLQLSGLY